MKFKAVMYESLSMKQLSFLASTLTKLTKTCVLKLTTNEMSFLICEENTSPKQILVWSIIDGKQFFNEFAIEVVGHSCEIFIEFPTDMLSSSLNSLKNNTTNVRCVKLRLTNKQMPCLSIEIDVVSDAGSSRGCVHDIPIKLLPRVVWTDYTEPPTHNYDTILELKTLKKVKSVVERLKKLFSYLELKPVNEGFLSISGSTQAVTVSTTFKNVLLVEASDLEWDDSNVRVEAKKLHNLLCCDALNPKKISCSFLKNKLVHFIVYCEMFLMHFYLTTVDE